MSVPSSLRGLIISSSAVVWNRMDYCLEAEKQLSTIPVREGRLIPKKIKETIHSLKNLNHINKISYMLSEMWLPNVW